jgi:hypothetical protein
VKHASFYGDLIKFHHRSECTAYNVGVVTPGPGGAFPFTSTPFLLLQRFAW